MKPVYSHLFFRDYKLSEEENITNLASVLTEILKKLNAEREELVHEMVEKIVGSTIGHTRYHFIDPQGPKHGQVTSLHSIAVRYDVMLFFDFQWETRTSSIKYSFMAYSLRFNSHNNLYINKKYL